MLKALFIEHSSSSGTKRKNHQDVPVVKIAQMPPRAHQM
jgi:hypothetical protein